MKQNFKEATSILGLSLIFCLLFFPVLAQKNVHISGQVKGDNQTITFIDPFSEEHYPVKISAQGTFEIQLEVAQPTGLTLLYDQLSVYVFVKPETTLLIDIQSAAERVSFSGDLAKENNFSWEQHKKNIPNWKNIHQSYKLPVKDYLKTIEKKFLQEKARAESFQAQIAGMDQAYIEQSLLLSPYRLASNVLVDILNFLTFNNQDNARRKQILKYNLSPYLEGFAIENPELLNHATYRYFLKNYLAYLSFKNGYKIVPLAESNAYFLDQLKVLKKGVFKAPAINGSMAYYLLLEQLKMYRLKNGEKLLAFYQENLPNLIFQEKIDQLLSTIVATQPGNAIKNYTFEDILENPVALSDFRGKYVLLHLWTQNNIASRIERKDLKAIMQTFMDKNIVFLSVSLDDKMKWKNWQIEQREEYLIAQQVLAKEGRESPIVKDFLVSFENHFILIDPEGKIVDPEVPSPSNGLKKVLEKLKL